jgi:hypothetical protein
MNPNRLGSRYDHGEAINGRQTPEYIVWCNMNKRCRNPKNKSFKYYGGAGIKVCQRWRSFKNFIADMGRRPSPSHSIERRNSHKDYEPSNCYWATRTEQNNNKSDTVLITYNGKTRSAGAWARLLGFKKHTLYFRLKSGWPTKRMLTTPVRKWRAALTILLLLAVPIVCGADVYSDVPLLHTNVIGQLFDDNNITNKESFIILEPEPHALISWTNAANDFYSPPKTMFFYGTNDHAWLTISAYNPTNWGPSSVSITTTNIPMLHLGPSNVWTITFK